MTPSATFRPLAALALAACVFLALPGCGSGKPQPSGQGDDKNKPGEPKPGPGQPGDPKPQTPAPTPAKVDISTGVGKDAVDFLQAVVGGTAKADQLSAAFVKAVGRPIVFDGDKSKGFSASAAEDWMRKVGGSTGFGLPLKADQVGDVALFRGMLVGKPGAYALRMVKEGGAWKVDWLSASSVAVKKMIPVPAGSGDAILQEFAASAVVEAICDQDAMPAPQRAAVVAAGLTPALRTSWAPPFDSDKKDGYDYNPGKLGFKIGDIGGKAESVSYTQTGDGAYVAEVTKSGSGKPVAYLVKLAKGPNPGQWLVENITAQ